ncbi:hypothetical protein B0H11DRAFT_1254045 [Mycena galericulata]|nr:hypothetical protein B0H11DRAFT_1254045 [Mycena galericulata]
MTSADLDRAERLWYPPDVVVLRAETRVFRVFVAILKEKSSVFADMFTFPQPPSADMETIEGSPVVNLSDDPAEMEVFLRAIFDSEFFLPPPAMAEFEDIVAVLRLSHKYDVPFLRRRALKHLGTLYSTSLLEREDEDSHPSSVSCVRCPSAWFPALYHLRSIKVAAEVGALWLLPAAYYDLCDREIQTILSAGPLWDDLGEVQKMACIVGHSAQIQYFPNITAFHFKAKDETSECADWIWCNRMRLYFAGDVPRSPRRPLEAILDGDDYWDSVDADMCAKCVEEMKAEHRAGKLEFWAQLPQMFGLPDWKELEEMRQAQVGA